MRSNAFKCNFVGARDRFLLGGVCTGAVSHEDVERLESLIQSSLLHSENWEPSAPEKRPTALLPLGMS
eukprot:NODE_10067_length_347_cov_7.100671_g9159_i0.p3 GENE.NODE_10067_length_347_cov_7.100671_g9159_i0~~NODE_10067_length_347_cov_7.100671_g9159_i0.p3  ORF type:complete len:68 (+),score=18.82 NODE_10067_length_347_cov_7.100671_g9159_i0:142-345(+)